VLVLVIGGVGAFAIYTFGWRGDSSSEQRAMADAEAIAAQWCDPQVCIVESVTHIDGDAWQAVLRNPGRGYVVCALLQTDRFAERASGDFAGASLMTCPEARPGRSHNVKVGAEWWETGYAGNELAPSKWAFGKQLNEAIFDCVGRGPTRASRFRHFACTYEYGGASLDQSGRVEITTTGRNTLRVDSFTFRDSSR
jgi:hypothetical protein